MSNEINEKIFKSVDTIVSARLLELLFDKTIVGKIEATPASDDGALKYSVNYKGASIVAFVNDKNKTYNLDDEVYVLVPQGDFTLRKLITGLVISDYTESSNDVSLKFIKVHTIVNNSLANEYILNIKSTKSYANNGYLFLSDLPKYTGYTYMKVKVGYRADLKDNYTSKQVVDGKYAVEAIMTYLDQSGKELTSKVDTYTWTQDDMVLLNKYQTGGYTNQEFYIDVKDKIITRLLLNFYQNGDFIYSDGTSVELTDDIAIRIRDYSIEIGYKKADLLNSKSTDENYGLYLYSASPLTYTSTDTERTYSVRLIDMATGLDITATAAISYCYLYIQDTSKTTSSNEVGAGWGTLVTGKVMFLSRSMELDNGIQNLSLDFIAWIKLTTEEAYVSNVLSFKNASYTANSELLDLLVGLKATPQDNSNLFYVYGQDNQLINASDGERIHRLTLTFTSGDTSKNTLLSEGDSITYTIPKYNTMLIPVDSPILGGDSTVYTFSKLLKSTDLDNGMYFIPFKIAPLYSPQYKNNTINITANILKSGTYTTSQEFLFGNSGSSGANYILRIYLANSNGVEKRMLDLRTIGSETYSIRYELYNYSWEKITDTNGLEDLKYSWVYGNAVTAYTLNEENGAIQIADTSNYMSTHQTARLVVEVSCTYKGNVLKSYLAIPTTGVGSTSLPNYSCIDGCSIITYDITGKKPFYAKQAYSVYYTDSNGDAIKLSDDMVYYKMYNALSASNSLATENLINFNDKDGVVTPPAVYSGQEGYPYVLVYTKLNASYTNYVPAIVQPIYMIENSYPVAMWNDLNSNITFKAKGLLNSTMVGQLNSSKDTGVVMGTFENDGNKEFGLYGFNGGNIIFELSNKGIARILTAHSLSDTNQTLYSVGSAGLPVYFNGGIPVAGTDFSVLISNLQSLIASLKSDVASLKNRVAALEAAN